MIRRFIQEMRLPRRGWLDFNPKKPTSLQYGFAVTEFHQGGSHVLIDFSASLMVRGATEWPETALFPNGCVFIREMVIV